MVRVPREGYASDEEGEDARCLVRHDEALHVPELTGKELSAVVARPTTGDGLQGDRGSLDRAARTRRGVFLRDEVARRARVEHEPSGREARRCGRARIRRSLIQLRRERGEEGQGDPLGASWSGSTGEGGPGAPRGQAGACGGKVGGAIGPAVGTWSSEVARGGVEPATLGAMADLRAVRSRRHEVVAIGGRAGKSSIG